MAAVVVATLVTGCVGSVSRSEFEADIRERGGGITGEQLDVAVSLAADEAAVADPATLEMLRLRADAVTRLVIVQPRRGDQPEFVDNIVVRDDDVLSAEPIQDAGDFDIDALAVAVSEVPLDDAAEFIDRAIAEFGDEGTIVSSYEVFRQGGTPVVVVQVESPRRTGAVTFDTDGSIIEVTS